MRKYMVIMELIAFEVQANDLDLALPSLCTSSLPNCISHHSQLDVMGRRGVLDKCIKKELGKCVRKHGLRSLEFNECFIYNFFQWTYKLQSLVIIKFKDAILYAHVKECMDLCFPILGDLNIDKYTACLFNCYEKRIKKKN
jgi:hypothetical protein